MNEFIKKIRVAVGLYRPTTLLSKFYELFIINRKRFLQYEIKTNPLLILPQTADNNSPDPRVSHIDKGHKTIYFLVHCFYPFSQGGTERFIYNMATEASNNGNDVKIITYNATQPRSHFKHEVSQILFNEYQIDGLDVIEYRHKRAPRGILKDLVLDDSDVLAFAQYLFSRHKPDFVHVGYLQKVSSFIDACRKLAVPYGITLTSFYCLCHFDIMIDKHGNLCSGSEKGNKCGQICSCMDVKNSFERCQKINQILKDASFITAPSQFVKLLVEKEFPDLHVQVVNHGISRAFIPADHDQLERKNEIKNVAYVGNLIPIKGVHGLITVFNELSPDYILNIYGSGSEVYINRLKNLAAGRENIIFHGSIKYDEISQVYQKNEIVVVPSIWYETYNFVVHEALMMNRIVIAANIGAIPERIKNIPNSFCFQAGNWHDLKSVLGNVIDHKAKLVNGTGLLFSTVQNEYASYDLLYNDAIEMGQ